MRFGPDETTTPNFDVAPTLFGVIAKNGGLWRNDGFGWYATTVSPGVGMDPTTASLLPTLLRNVTKVTDLGQVTLAGQSTHRFSGLVDISAFPVSSRRTAPRSPSPRSRSTSGSMARTASFSSRAGQRTSTSPGSISRSTRRSRSGTSPPDHLRSPCRPRPRPPCPAHRSVPRERARPERLVQVRQLAARAKQEPGDGHASITPRYPETGRTRA